MTSDTHAASWRHKAARSTWLGIRASLRARVPSTRRLNESWARRSPASACALLRRFLLPRKQREVAIALLRLCDCRSRSCLCREGAPLCRLSCLRVGRLSRLGGASGCHSGRCTALRLGCLGLEVRGRRRRQGRDVVGRWRRCYGVRRAQRHAVRRRICHGPRMASTGASTTEKNFSDQEKKTRAQRGFDLRTRTRRQQHAWRRLHPQHQWQAGRLWKAGQRRRARQRRRCAIGRWRSAGQKVAGWRWCAIAARRRRRLPSKVAPAASAAQQQPFPCWLDDARALGVVERPERRAWRRRRTRWRARRRHTGRRLRRRQGGVGSATAGDAMAESGSLRARGARGHADHVKGNDSTGSDDEGRGGEGGRVGGGRKGHCEGNVAT